jgi:hypothetical protein
MNRADQLCDEFDAAVFSGDAFTEQRDLTVLRAHLARWDREASERQQALQKERDQQAKDDAAGDLA